MKKILISFLCVSLLVLTSCKVVAEPTNVSNKQQATTVPTTTVNPEDELYAKLAQLTKEDGTGEINITMTVDEITNVLDKYDIKYTTSSVSVTVGKNLYSTYSHDIYGRYSIQQSYKGLKVGDSVEKIKELYGEPTKSYMQDGMNIFDYQTGTASDIYNSPIMFTILTQNYSVKEIFVGVVAPLDKIYG